MDAHRGSADKRRMGRSVRECKRATTEQMASRKKDKSLYKCSYCFRIYKTVYRLMQHLLNHQTKQVKLPKPSRVLKIEELKIEKKLPTCKLIISRCDNLISPGQRHGTIHIRGTNMQRRDAIGKKLARPRSGASESGISNGVTEKIGSRKLASSTEVDANSMKPYKCQLCQRSFGELGHLKMHIRTHTGERPFQCQICSKAFGLLQTLNSHIRTHTGERPHGCQICSKPFAQLSHLKRHIRTHTGERPHKCQLCSKSFGEKGTLERHIRTHTGERPHQCQLCSKSFGRLGTLNSHIHTHTGERLHHYQ